MTGGLVAAAPAADPPSYNTVSPGIAGFLVIFVLALATIVLIRSMVGHLRKVRYGPDPDAAGESPAPEVSPDEPAAPSAPPAPPAATQVPPVSGGPGRQPPG